MQHLPGMSSEPSSERSPNRPAHRVSMPTIVLLIILLTTGLVFLPPYLTEIPYVSVYAPNLNIRYHGGTDGDLYLVDGANSALFYKQKISPTQYARVEAKWLDNRHVLLTTTLRLCTKLRLGIRANGYSYICDCDSGSLTDPTTGKRTAIRSFP